jgi:uncharacterized protein YfaS (alpha-2-macroglobulin family)
LKANYRDDRVEAFAMYLEKNSYEYKYEVRATAKGVFGRRESVCFDCLVVPPARVEEMYSPDVFGRSEVDFVTVE